VPKVTNFHQISSTKEETDNLVKPSFAPAFRNLETLFVKREKFVVLFLRGEEK